MNHADDTSGFWVFNREMLDKLISARGLTPEQQALVLQTLDSPEARAIGLHVLERRNG